MDENETLLVQALAKNPDFIKWFWNLANGFVNNTTINDNWQARAGYEALRFMDPIIRAAQAQVMRFPTVQVVPQFEEKACARCHKQFRTNNGSDLCYNCTLDDITNGMPPEEGDFNTAMITSGTMTDLERAWLQQDLKAVENGTSNFEPEDEREFLEWEDDDEVRHDEEEEDCPEDEEPDDWMFNEREAAKWGDEG